MNTKTFEQRLLELEMRVAKLEVVNPVQIKDQSQLSQKKLSAKEFLLTKALKTETQKTLALGYYLEHVESLSSFNIDDLTAVFQAAKEKRPQNMNDAVNKNIARGLLMEISEKKDSKKAWVLTLTGEKYIENELNNG